MILRLVLRHFDKAQCRQAQHKAIKRAGRMQVEASQFITLKDLIVYILGSSGLLALIFAVVSKLFDRTSRVMIMNEIKSIDEKYQNRLAIINKEVTKLKLNYLDRFADPEASKEPAAGPFRSTRFIATKIRYIKIFF